MNTSKNVIAILIGLLVLIITVSGCTSFNSNVKNKTFSNGGITFQYPGTWADNITFNYAKAPSSETTVLGTMGDNITSVAVASINLTAPILSSFSIESLAQATYSSSEGGLQHLSLNKSTSNNITFYEIIYTSKDGVTNDTYKNYLIMFGEQGKNAYQILFKTKEADFEKSYPTFKEIQSSITKT